MTKIPSENFQRNRRRNSGLEIAAVSGFTSIKTPPTLPYLTPYRSIYRICLHRRVCVEYEIVVANSGRRECGTDIVISMDRDDLLLSHYAFM
ncbi:predicted protein [Sclerotinia sclerotiorum 1980 UF-70]|uniref:Uncharacterized protein n=1 Tax=Sclerotinia sclerotiorum (strain ATCC 18683 / 1980 / Ss-1) TaxID=665079 RepID=A7F167_SCLS1|nr:predicted protein [Sclerotinia sclerotiorum 1980 UF-70]EDN95459.1 predicted protein [Sclerotinia sclerotiorum 1980 UF-70]